jgi:hypothetical protein
MRGARTPFGGRIALTQDESAEGHLTGKELEIMNPTAKPVKKSKKVVSNKKLERKNPLMSVRSLMVKW